MFYFSVLLKMFKIPLRTLSIFTLIFFGLACGNIFAQVAEVSGGTGFIRGNYVEVAVSNAGTFASNVPAPQGFHPRGPEGNFYTSTNSLGIVADVQRNGWEAGSPNYIGDYLLAGSPEEGFGITVNGYNYNNNMIGNEVGIQGSIVEASSNNTHAYTKWQGYLDGLTITAKTYIPVNSLYFVTEVSITNHSLSTANDVFYMRNIDPDQGALTPGGNGFETLNTIVHQNPNSCGRAMVTSTSLIGNYYLGLGTLDPRARVSYGGFANRSAYDAYYGYGLYTSGSLSDDIAMSLAFSLGDIAPNQTVKFSYVYMLDPSQSDVKAALAETAFKYSYNGISYTNNSVTDVCFSSASKQISIQCDAGGYTNWTWYPADIVSYNSPDGKNVSINTNNYTLLNVVGSGACGEVSMNIQLNPVSINPPGAVGQIYGQTQVQPISYSMQYVVEQVPNATSYIWSYPPGFVPVGETNASYILLNSSSVGGCGNIKVSAQNACGIGPESAITVCTPGLNVGSLNTQFSANSLCSPLSSSINYTSTEIGFQPDNIFTVLLSNQNGDFSIPYYVGSLTSSQPSGSIPIYIPQNLPGGYGYKMRIISSNPYYESTENSTGMYMSASIPTAPTGITQELISNTCGGRVYRYTAAGFVSDTIGYRWTLPTSLGGISGVYCDSGDVNSSRVIKVKYVSNAAASTTDSVRVRAYSGCGFSATRSAKLINTLLAAPNAPASLTITPVVTNVCSGKIYRYSAPALIAATSTNVAAIGWKWTFLGSLASTATIDSGSLTSQVIKVKFINGNAATTGDSVQIAYTSSCGNSANRSAILTNTLLTVPDAPASITITPVTNDCNSRIFRYSAPSLVTATSTSVAASGWQWVFVGPLNSTTTAVVDSGSLTSQTVRIKYYTNNPAYAGDSVRLAYTSTCGLSPNRSAILTNTYLAAPSAPASVTITPVSATCGAVYYRYRAPALTAGTTTTGSPTGWAWSFVGTLGANAVIDSGTNSSQVIVVKFTSSAAAATTDSVRVCYTSGCGNSPWKSAKLTNTTLTAPAAPASITITAVSITTCGNKIYRYTAPALTGTATGYQWSFVGTLGLNATLDSGSLTSRIVRMKFTSNVAATTDSARVMFTSPCGNSTITRLKLTNTLLTAPAAPASVTSTTIVSNVCGGRTYRYTAPVLPAATTTAVAASGYVWSFTGPLHAAGNYVIDSGTINSRIIRIKYSSNAAASTTDSARVLYTSGCGNSPNKSLKLTHTIIGPPAVPASVTSTAIITNVCGGRVYRFTAPVLPAATTTAVAATGYIWSFTGPLHYNAATGGANFVIDSGTINSRIIRIKYLTNVAASTTDSARVCYTSSCGNSLNKSLKLTLAILNSPAAPAALTITQVANICGARVYRYSTSALVAATTTAGAATGWQWSFVGTLGLNATVDSGTLTSQIVRMKFTNNGAATTDSARVAYNSGCGLGTRKTAKLTNTALTCFARTIQNNASIGEEKMNFTADIFPNPSQTDFILKMGAQSGLGIVYRVLDSRGAVVEKGVLSSRNTQRMGANWKPGVYVVEIIQEGKRITRKIIKQ